MIWQDMAIAAHREKCAVEDKIAAGEERWKPLLPFHGSTIREACETLEPGSMIKLVDC